jgi:hypothetical protein
MSSRPLIAPFKVITNGDMSANITSKVSIISNISMLSYAYSWAGSSPVGTITVEVSNDYTVNGAGTVSNAGTWTALTFVSAGSVVSSLAVSGNTGTGFIDIDAISAYAIRTKYNFTSGTGTLQATVAGKVM